MDKSTVLIHIGYHKTGSSLLQKYLFKQQKTGFYSPWQPQEYIEKIIISNPFTFDAKNTRSFFQPSISEAHKLGLVPAITHEMFSGNPWKGGYNSKTTADRLWKIFPEGRVLIVIREQTSMILSLYKHRVRNNLTVSIETYLESPPEGSGFEPLFRLEYLNYHWLISYYQDLFGTQNVLVLPYEMLRNEYSVFFKKISEFAETEIETNLTIPQIVNPGYSGFVVGLKRWSNYLFASRYSTPDSPWVDRLNNAVFYKLNKWIPKQMIRKFDLKLENTIKNKVEGFYKESNNMTIELIGMDLEKYGYQV